MNLFNVSKLGMFDKISYMNPDLPIQKRVAKGFLIGFKRLLISKTWDFQKSCVHFDETSGVLSVGGVEVLKASVQKFEFKLDFLATSWANWSELNQDPQFQELKRVAESKLAEASKRMDKGKGKGSASA